MATVILRQSTQVIVRLGPFMDSLNAVTPETGVTLAAADQAELLKAAGAATVDISGNTFAAVTNCAGWYDLTLSTTDTNTVGDLTVVIQDESVCLPVCKTFQVVEEAVYDQLYASSAPGAATPTAVSNIQSDTDDIQLRLPAALTTGTADSGTTTTMVDAALTQADTDYWKGMLIRFTSGNISGQTRLITGFTPASDTITFAPATTQAVGTNTYEILPCGPADLIMISGDPTAADNLEAVLDGTGAVMTLTQLRVNSSAAGGAIDVDNSGGPAVSYRTSSGDAVDIASTGGNGDGISIAGNGSGHGILSTGGATGDGVRTLGGATSGDGIHAESQTTGIGIEAIGKGNSPGIQATGAGIGDGIHAEGGASGDGIGGSGQMGIHAEGDTGIWAEGVNGDGILAEATGGNGIHANANAGQVGLLCEGGTGAGIHAFCASGNGHGIQAQGTGTGFHGITATGNGIGSAGINASGTLNGIASAGGGAGHGIHSVGGATGHGINALGGATSGDGIHAEADTLGDGIEAVGAGGGFDINADIQGSLSGSVGSIAAGGISAASFAANSITASALASDAADEIIAAVSGTADSGTITTLVDAARTEADNDYWNGSLLLITSGSTQGQIRRITDFDAATDTITVDPAFTQAISTNTYLILRTAIGTAAAGGSLTQQDVRDAMKLAPTAGAPAAGSVDEHLDDILADTNVIEPLVSTNLDATISSRATPAQVNTEVDTALADIRLDELIFNAASPATPTINSFVDRITSKDGAQTYDRSTDSLEALADSGGGGLTQQQVRDAMKLSPTAGAPAAGSVDEHLDDILADTAAMQPLVDVAISSRAAPGDAMDLVANALDSGTLDSTAVNEIADQVWDELLAGHLAAGSTGAALNDAASGGAGLTQQQVRDALLLAPGGAAAAGSIDDLLADIMGPGFNSATDSLEEIRDRIEECCGGGGGSDIVNIEGG